MTTNEAAARKRPLWSLVLIAGIVLWALAIGVLWATKDTTLVPSVIFTGSFIFPVSFAIWAIEREQYSGATPDGQPSELTTRILVAAFAGAGLLGVVTSALLETLLLANHRLLFYPGVAVIEETIKLALVWFLARRLTTYYRRDGMVLGACVGFGFAAFESAGYAFNALLKDSNSTNILAVVESQLVRGLLTPVGHGLWTGLLGGALFAAAKNDKLRLTASVLGWWLAAVVLHALWDTSTGLSVLFTYLTTGQQVSVEGIENGQILDATATQVHLIAVYSWVLLSICSIVGIFLANRMWVKGRAVVAGFPHGPDPVTDPAEA